jgi:flagellar hook-associated protein 1 FlgK
MSLDSTLSIASGGLANINRQLAVVSHNVANASTPGYTRQVGHQTALSSGGIDFGVRSGVPTRSIDVLMQNTLWRQNATVAALQVRSDALAAIDTAHGTPGQGDDLSSLTGTLHDSFSTLSSDPSSAPAQGQVVSAARALADGINRVADAVTGQRQVAQETLVQDIKTLNEALQQIGTLSDRIKVATVEDSGTASLEDERDAVLQTVSNLTDAQVMYQPNGDVQVMTRSGLLLPTHPPLMPLQIDDATMGPTTSGPSVMLQGVDVTAQLSGGKIGAEISLRDTELPTMQAELDEFAHDLTTRFDSAGLSLFTDPAPSGVVAPPVQAPYVGLANRIQVNAVVAANPALVRDGTDATINAPTGQASYGAVISKVLNAAFGTSAQAGVASPAVSGLGISGTLSAPFASPTSLASFASTLVSVQTSASTDVTTRLSQEQATQSVLSDKVSAVSGVSVDTEMSTMIGLQNAYAANARIISTMQQMWTQLLGMVGG